MSQRRLADVNLHHNPRIRRRSAILRAVETAISIAVSMTPLSLAAFSAFSGA